MTDLNKSTMEKIKTSDKASISISNTKTKSTKMGVKETKSIKVLTAVGTVTDHTVVNLLNFKVI